MGVSDSSKGTQLQDSELDLGTAYITLPNYHVGVGGQCKRLGEAPWLSGIGGALSGLWYVPSGWVPHTRKERKGRSCLLGA